MPSPRKFKIKGGSLSLRGQKCRKPVPDFTGQQRYYVGLDEQGRPKHVILRPDQVERAREKYPLFIPTNNL